VAVVVRGDVWVPDYPGQELAGLPGPARRGAVNRVADAGELSLEILGVRGVTAPAVCADALDDGGRLGAADAAERLDVSTTRGSSQWPQVVLARMTPPG
jgi:hypothetical protein